jgi:hypothetical protein
MLSTVMVAEGPPSRPSTVTSTTRLGGKPAPMGGEKRLQFSAVLTERKKVRTQMQADDADER